MADIKRKMSPPMESFFSKNSICRAAWIFNSNYHRWLYWTWKFKGTFIIFCTPTIQHQGIKIEVTKVIGKYIYLVEPCVYELLFGRALGAIFLHLFDHGHCVFLYSERSAQSSSCDLILSLAYNKKYVYPTLKPSRSICIW